MPASSSFGQFSSVSIVNVESSAVPDVAPVLGILLVEEDPADHAVDVHEHQRQDREAQDRRDRADQRLEEDAEVGQDGDDSHHPQEADDPQERRVLADAGHERQRDHDEVEDVPAVLEEVLRPRAERGDADDQLDDEDPEEDVVERREQRLDAVSRGRRSGCRA